jgi:hypothetical protein
MAMKMGKTVLIEVLNVVRIGFAKMTDISQLLRDVEFEEDPEEPGTVRLTKEYESSRNDDPESF